VHVSSHVVLLLTGNPVLFKLVLTHVWLPATSCACVHGAGQAELSLLNFGSQVVSDASAGFAQDFVFAPQGHLEPNVTHRADLDTNLPLVSKSST
jgi:hypothetical protein